LAEAAVISERRRQAACLHEEGPAAYAANKPHRKHQFDVHESKRYLTSDTHRSRRTRRRSPRAAGLLRDLLPASRVLRLLLRGYACHNTTCAARCNLPSFPTISNQPDLDSPRRRPSTAPTAAAFPLHEQAYATRFLRTFSATEPSMNTLKC
jgi:hypothetical protein